MARFLRKQLIASLGRLPIERPECGTVGSDCICRDSGVGLFATALSLFGPAARESHTSGLIHISRPCSIIRLFCFRVEKASVVFPPLVAIHIARQIYDRVNFIPCFSLRRVRVLPVARPLSSFSTHIVALPPRAMGADAVMCPFILDSQGICIFQMP